MRGIKKIIIGAVALLALSGCGQKAEEDYQAAMTSGIEAIGAKEYSKVEKYFGEALAAKEESKAKDHQQQVITFQALEKSFAAGDLAESEKLVTKIDKLKQGSKALNKKTHELAEEIKQIRKNQESYQQQLTTIETLHKEGKYAECQTKIEELNKNDLSGIYYQEILDKVGELKPINDTKLAEWQAAEAKKAEEERIAAEAAAAAAAAQAKADEKAGWLSTNDPQKYLDAYYEFKGNDLGISGVGLAFPPGRYESVGLSDDEYSWLWEGSMKYYQNLYNQGKISEKETGAATQEAWRKAGDGSYSYLFAD